MPPLLEWWSLIKSPRTTIAKLSLGWYGAQALPWFGFGLLWTHHLSRGLFCLSIPRPVILKRFLVILNFEGKQKLNFLALRWVGRKIHGYCCFSVCALMEFSHSPFQIHDKLSVFLVLARKYHFVCGRWVSFYVSCTLHHSKIGSGYDLSLQLGRCVLSFGLVRQEVRPMILLSLLFL